MLISELCHKLQTIQRLKGDLFVKVFSKSLNAIEDVVIAYQLDEHKQHAEHLVFIPLSETREIATENKGETVEST